MASVALAATPSPFGEVSEEVVKALPNSASPMVIASGFVFVDGSYMAPPYKVQRYGNVIRINGVQVTGPIVPWEEFLRAQAGYRIEKAPPGMVKKLVEEEYVETVKEEVEIDVSDDIDDLFETEPTETAKPGKARKEKRIVTKEVKKTRMVEKFVPGDGPEVDKVVFDGVFKQNGKVRTLVGRIEREQKRIQAELKQGKLLCFGHAYATTTGDYGAGRLLVEKLWRVQKENDQVQDFISAAHAAGISFVTDAVLKDMFLHRLEYPVIQNRARSGK